MREVIKRAKNQKGFTLVELMVVVVIIGILVMIAVPIFNAVTERAEEKACQANQRTIDGAVMMWTTEEGNMGETPTMDELADYLDDTGLYCPSGDSTDVYAPAAPGGKTPCPTGKHDR